MKPSTYRVLKDALKIPQVKPLRAEGHKNTGIGDNRLMVRELQLETDF